MYDSNLFTENALAKGDELDNVEAERENTLFSQQRVLCGK